MIQPCLFDWKAPARARKSDPPTSGEAAASMTVVRISSLEQTVLNALVALGGQATIEQVADYTQLSLVTVSPRFAPLKAKGFIRDTGRKGTNRSRSRAIVWEVVR